MLQGSVLCAEIRLRELRNHSENLIRSIHFLLNVLDWRLEDLDLIASGIGPGSFTGIRIGLSTGIGMAQSLSIPFAGVSGLEAHGFQAVSTEGITAVVLNAHRDQAYYAEYRNWGGRMQVARPPSLIEVPELPLIVGKRRIYLTGDTELYHSNKGRQKEYSRPDILHTDPYLAAAIGRRALSVRRRWKSGKYIQCEPLYIRPPDAVQHKTRRI